MDSSTHSTLAPMISYLSLIISKSKRLRGREVTCGTRMFWTVLAFVYLSLSPFMSPSASGQTPQPVTINFDGLAAGALVTNQYSQVKFSASGFSAGSGGANGYDLYTQNNSGLGSSPYNAIRGLYNQYNPSFDCYGNTEVFLDFPVPVNNFSFLMLNMYPNYFGSPYYTYVPYTSGQIDVYVNWAYYGTYNIEIPGQYRNPNTPFPINFLSGIQGITGIRIRSTSGSGGPINAAPYPSCTRIYYDDFTFTPDLAVQITSARVSGVLNGTTQNALAGVDIALNASVLPTSRTGGSYSWTFTGPYTLVSGTANSSSVTIRANDAGTVTAKVSYTLNGVTSTASLNVNSVIPTLASFTAQVVDVDQINRGPRCSGVASNGAIYSLGCAVPNPDLTWNVNNGIIFTGTAQIPSGNYLTDPAQAGIKFKQYSSEFRKRILDVDSTGYYAFGQVQCSTRRNSEADINSGWQVDGNEAYGHPFIRPVPRFSQGNTLTYQTFDVPAQTLDDSSMILTSIPHMSDAFYADIRFEMYVDYFVGPNPNTPSFKRTLRIASDSNYLYHRIVWQWGGQAYYDSAISTTRYKLQFSTTTPQGTINAIPTNSIVPFQGNISDNQWGICPGGPAPSNIRIDGVRYFVLQLYSDVLHRGADQVGWNNWTSTIASCGFDGACINNMRIHTARGFLESSENFGNNPALTSPDSHVYNREYVRLCYTSFLGRDPDEIGWNNWTDYLDTHPGGYSHVVGGFINSSEYRNRSFPNRN